MQRCKHGLCPLAISPVADISDCSVLTGELQWLSKPNIFKYYGTKMIYYPVNSFSINFKANRTNI